MSTAMQQSSTLDPIPREHLASITIDDAKRLARCRFFTFDTSAHIDVRISGNAPSPIIAILQSLIDQCRSFERLFSRTLPHSDVSRINQAHGEWTGIDAQTAELIETAMHYCAESEGLFDIDIGPLVQLWDWRNQMVPSREAVANALSHVDFRTIEIEHDPVTGEYRCRLSDPQATIDLDGIAKGWIANRLAAILLKAGFSNFLIDLGGNTIMHGTPSPHHGWRTATLDPQSPAAATMTLEYQPASATDSGPATESFASSRIDEPRANLQTNCMPKSFVCSRGTREDANIQSVPASLVVPSATL
ncbi:FAD:protein FMN transferase [Bifidobacterium imperatoris]|uniref:FAD:protein FMN transferase n=1 Tax=Bifidobacterium imperatoris TaxID=2020965 RepID=A0A2N5IPD9_9BIFI|nr:FAD:protein FMN transferase [Bifidobacterium imperatoris]PLS23825.1 thiamine biosynthesis protein ApbE [Bifidobacterium imperatoris]QSY57391.1 FAD:protein FMN transferase [Bifidobacterium imperatoris]